ncbi:MAG TPA: transferrin receptor-like dimerization domain-containing protein [Candidatus Acidoferrales bacterium]|nr:transferrin receptor-like dimerization domain-containing protein [Candidatus Acidoferrales bacterium]
MNRWLRILAPVGLAALAVGLAAASGDAQPPASSITGFSPRETAAEAQWEQKFRALPQPANIRNYMEILSKEPHALGQPYDEQNAQYVLGQFKSFGLDAHIETFYVLFPTPLERQVELLEPARFTAKLQEPPIAGDPTSGQSGQLPTYNAYSIDGDVTGQLVYVNYGLPEDYDQLAKLHIDVRGKIVIARYGRSWRGIKPKVAAEHGAIGCLIYSDPRDDGYFQGDVYPKGPYRPPDGVQRGSVADEASNWPGDPLTPGIGATKEAKRLTFDQARKLFTSIPTQPISYADAQPLLAALAGPVAPAGWRGALPLTYHIGPGPALVHLKLKFDWSQHPINDVIAVIAGSEWPDQWVVHGNHYDGWVNGADDPISGASALVEDARAFGDLLKHGWHPKRTIVLALWDGEEPGLLGSTEWAEEHAEELQQKAVAYINSDSSGRGTFGMSGSHTLEPFLNQLARDFADPITGKSLYEMDREKAIENAKTPQARAAIEKRADLRIGALGSGSDYSAFIDHLGIASANLGFSEEGGGGVYHSIYDDFYWYTHFGDTDFAYENTFAQAVGVALMRLADASVLPFDFTDLADTIAQYRDQLKQLQHDAASPPAFDFSALDASVDRLEKAASDYAAAYERATNSGSVFRKTPAQLAQLNELLYDVDRKMTTASGLPGGRGWYKNQIYAPGAYTGYGVKTLPGIRENMEQNHWQDAAIQEQVVAGVLDAIAAQIEAARARL